MKRRSAVEIGLLAAALTAAPCRAGDVVFIHPDGSGPSHWTAADSDASGMQLLPLRRSAAESPNDPVACEELSKQDRRTCARPSDPPLVTSTSAIGKTAPTRK